MLPFDPPCHVYAKLRSGVCCTRRSRARSSTVRSRAGHNGVRRLQQPSPRSSDGTPLSPSLPGPPRVGNPPDRTPSFPQSPGGLTPRTSSAGANAAGVSDAAATAAARLWSVQRETLPAGNSIPPASISGRRNLRNFESRPPPTDFETWKQAETALQAGLSVKHIVASEFNRSFGGDAVACAAPHLTVLHLRRCMFYFIGLLVGV